MRKIFLSLMCAIMLVGATPKLSADPLIAGIMSAAIYSCVVVPFFIVGPSVGFASGAGGYSLYDFLSPVYDEDRIEEISIFIRDAEHKHKQLFACLESDEHNNYTACPEGLKSQFSIRNLRKFNNLLKSDLKKLVNFETWISQWEAAPSQQHFKSDLLFKIQDLSARITCLVNVIDKQTIK